MSTLPFQVGDIVALNSHPYYSEITSILISGDHLSLPPLMVVAEVLMDSKNAFDEHTGNPISESGAGQCKCIWYSTKSFQFEEAWISTNLLKLIDRSSTTTNIERNQIIVLKTHDLELGKQKSALTIDGNQSSFNKSATTISPLLSFVSPIMHAVEIRKHDDKEPKYNPKNGNVRRLTPSSMVKCKWYNASNDKISEKFLPAEILQKVTIISSQVILDINSKIGSSTFYKVSGTLVKPMNITYRGSHYYLRGLDYVKNIVSDYKIEEPNSFVEITDPILSSAPVFDDLKNPALSTKATQEVRDAIQEALNAKQYIRIVYRNRNDKVETRTIRDYSFEHADGEDQVYLKGFCHLRESERTFRIDRIQNLQVLNLTY